MKYFQILKLQNFKIQNSATRSGISPELSILHIQIFLHMLCSLLLLIHDEYAINIRSSFDRPYIDTLTVRSCTGPCESTAEFEQHSHIGPSAAYRTLAVSFPGESGIPQPRGSQHTPSAQTAAAAAAPGSQTISSSPAQ